MNKPRITVLLPVYNGEKYIKEAMESILNQTFTNFEFLIIDDCSTDSSLKIIRSYKDPYIRIIHNETNKGLNKTLNIGLAAARGEYIARMDQDDISLPRRLEKQLAFLDTHSEIGVCGTGFGIIDQKGTLKNETHFPNRPLLLSWKLHFFCPLAHPTVMMRTSLVKEIGGYNTKARFYEDYDLWIRLNSITKLTNLDDILFLLRKHEENTSQIHLNEQINSSIKLCRELISKTLDRNVSNNIVQHLYLKNIDNANSVVQINNLIRDLYDAFVQKHDIESNDLKLIKGDVALQLFIPAIRFWYNIRIWKFFYAILIFDPWFVFKGSKYLVMKFTKNRS
ncbi:MAG: glycosyltransferase [Patescibacteria group bacterium]